MRAAAAVELAASAVAALFAFEDGVEIAGPLRGGDLGVGEAGGVERRRSGQKSRHETAGTGDGVRMRGIHSSIRSTRCGAARCGR